MSLPNNIPPTSKTDVQFQGIKLFIEGVQVPFIGISITSAIGALPTASISVPVQVGMVEITRFYSPKVHVFFVDPVDGEEKVMFSGIITSSSLSKIGAGSANINFACIHKYQLLSEFALDFSGWITGDSLKDANSASNAVKSNALSSKQSIAVAMVGIHRKAEETGGVLEVTQENVDTDKKNNTNFVSATVLPTYLKDYQERLVGIPGMMVNYYSQLKFFALSQQSSNDLMLKLYIPIVEKGTQFFQRLGGHFFIENKIQNDRIDPCVKANGPLASSEPRMIPPGLKVFLKSSVQTDMMLEVIRSMQQYSGELTDFLSLFANTLNSMDYEVLFLTSPAEVPINPANMLSATAVGQAPNQGSDPYGKVNFDAHDYRALADSTAAAAARAANSAANLFSSQDYDGLAAGASQTLALADPGAMTSAAMKKLSSSTTTQTETAALDVIAKPQLPFYYAPVCNVVYTNMIISLNVTQDDYSIPTRVEGKNSDIPGVNGNLALMFRAPASVREAIAQYAGFAKKTVSTGTNNTTNTTTTTGTTGSWGTGASGTWEDIPIGTTKQSAIPSDIKDESVADVPNLILVNTLKEGYNKVGRYEQGRGIKLERYSMPKWLSFYTRSQQKDPAGGDGWPDPTIDKENADAVALLRQGWINRYGIKNLGLNPWDRSSGLQAYQRLLVAHADYDYAMTIARSRNGSVEMIFDPYIIPGYAMDIIDDTPNHPSYHAYCTSVTHNITESSISTSAQFTCAMTYTELVNYYTPAAHPWLTYVLGMAIDQNLILADRIAKPIADDFYKPTLGVAAVSPLQLYDHNAGTILPVKRIKDGLAGGSYQTIPGANGGDNNPMNTGQGNISLKHRPIESRSNIETRFGVKFIDLNPGNYNSEVVKIRNQVLTDGKLLEPGKSQWLNYDDPMFTDNTTVDSEPNNGPLPQE